MPLSSRTAQLTDVAKNRCWSQRAAKPCPLSPAARHAGSISCAAEVTEHRLTPTDQHLVLGSAGLWDVLGPQDAALLAHFYEKVGLAGGQGFGAR